MTPPDKCIDINAFYRAFTPPSLVADIGIIVLKLPTIWSLKASRSRKVGLTMLFSVATLALIASILRCVSYFGTSATVNIA